MINDSGNTISFGISKVTDEEVSQLQGNYTKMPDSFQPAPTDIILKLTKIPKENGSDRFICETSLKKLLARKLKIPTWVELVNPSLDLRATIMKIIACFANYNQNSCNENDNEDDNKKNEEL